MKKLGIMLALLTLLLAACTNEKDEKAATVNGVTITKGELNDALMKQYGVEVLESLMTYEIIRQEAKKHDIDITEEDLQAEYEIYADYYGGEDALLESMETFHMTKKDIMNDIEIYLLTMQLLSKDISNTEEELQAFYEENKSSYVSDEGEQLAFEEVKSVVDSDLTEDKVNNSYEDWLDEKFEEYDIRSYLD